MILLPVTSQIVKKKSVDQLFSTNQVTHLNKLQDPKCTNHKEIALGKIWSMVGNW